MLPVKDGEFPKEYDPADITIYCACGMPIHISQHLYILYEERAIDFRCRKCAKEEPELNAFKDLARGIIEAGRCNFLDDVSAKVEQLAETAAELLEASKAKPNKNWSLKNAEKNRKR